MANSIPPANGASLSRYLETNNKNEYIKPSLMYNELVKKKY